MKTTIEDIEPIKKRLHLEIPPDIVTKTFDKILNEYRNNVTLKGFRKGKVPNDILLSYFGQEIDLKVKEEIFKLTFPKAIEENKIDIAGNPKIDFKEPVKRNQSFFYSAEFEVYPEFELPQYKGLELEVPELEITEDEIEEQLQYLRRYVAPIKPLEEDRPIQPGDIVKLTMHTSIAGEPVNLYDQEEITLEIDPKGNLNRLEANIVGLKKGESKTFEITYEDDAINAKLAGKTVKYDIVVRDVLIKDLPPIDEDFPSKYLNHNISIDKLRELLKEKIKEEKEEAIERYVRNQIFEKLSSQVDFPLPESLVQEKLNQMIDTVSLYLQTKGVNFEKAGITEERLRGRLLDEARQMVKCEIIFDKIADAEDIDISQEEVQEYLKKNEGALSGLNREQLAMVLKNNILPKLFSKEIMDFILKHANIKKIKFSDIPKDVSQGA